MINVWRRVYYGWVIVVIILIMQIAATGARYSFGVFLEPIASDMGWSIGRLSLAISGFLLVYGLASPLIGHWTDTFGARRVLLTGTAMMGMGIIVASASSELWHFALAITLLTGIGYSGLSPVVQSALISRWFKAAKGRALGVASSGIAIGQMLVVPAAMLVGLSLGWRVGLLVLGVSVLIFLPLGLLGLRDDPRQLGLHPDGGTTVVGEPVAAPDVSADGIDFNLIWTSSPFWLLTLSFFGCGFTMLMLATHLPNMMVQMAIPPALGGLAIGIIGGASGVGTILLSSLSDRYGRRVLLASAYALRIVMLLLLILIPSTTVVFLFAIFLGLTWIVTSPLTAGLSGDFFGSQTVGRVYGVCYLAHQLGAFIGTSAAGYLFDLTGSYTIALWLAVGITIISFILTCFIPSEWRRPGAVLGARQAFAENN